MKKFWLAALLLAATSMSVAIVHLKRDFIYDDQAVVESNIYVKAGNYGAIWGLPYWAGISGLYQQENLHRPAFLSFVAFFRETPFVLRIFVALAHILVSGLLWLWLRRENPEHEHINLLAAAIFLFHPANVEVTAQVIGLMEMVPTLLGLAALWLASTNPWLAVALAACAPPWKEIGYVWLAGLSVWFAVRRDYTRAGVAGVAVLAWLGLRYWVYGAVFESAKLPYELLNPLSTMGFVDMFWSRFALLGHNLALFLAPLKLSSDYSRGTIPLPGYPIHLWTLVGLFFLWVVYKIRARVPQAGWFAMATLLPSLHLTGATGIVFAERFGYTFRLGLAMLAVLGVRALSQNAQFAAKPALRKLSFATALLLTFVFFVRSTTRLAEWTTAERLFSGDLRRYPRNGKLHFNLGVAYGAKKKWEDAKRELQTCLNLAPDFPDAHFKLGAAYRELKDETQAQEQWGIAAELGYPVPRQGDK